MTKTSVFTTAPSWNETMTIHTEIFPKGELSYLVDLDLVLDIFTIFGSLGSHGIVNRMEKERILCQ